MVAMEMVVEVEVAPPVDLEPMMVQAVEVSHACAGGDFQPRNILSWPLLYVQHSTCL